MKNIYFLLIMAICLFKAGHAQINTLTAADGSVTITPKGLESKFTKGSNSSSNTGFGENALGSNTFGTDLISIGQNSHFTLSGGTVNYAVFNIAIGNGALYKTQPSIISGGYAQNAWGNVGIGHNSLYFNEIGGFNTALGYQSMRNNIASFNTAVGFHTLRANTSGSDNNALGYFSMASNEKGYSNSAFGSYSLYLNKNASQNVAIGRSALQSQSFANGGNAFNTDNVAIGNSALYSNNPTSTSNGIKNTAIGTRSMSDNKIGISNTAIGANSLEKNTYGSKNIAIGESALNSQSFSNSDTEYTTDNLAIGYRALYSNNPTAEFNGIKNIAIGNNSMETNTIGYENVSIGNKAMFSNSGGSSNVAIGTYTLNDNINGHFNTAIGYKALFKNTSNDNVALGDYALYNNIVGNENVAIGNQAGQSELGSGKLYIENSLSATPLIGGNFVTDVVGINMPITSLASNTSWKLQVGGDINATGSVRAAGVVLTSDKRFKKNIVQIENPLQNLLNLNAFTYNWRVEEFPNRNFNNKKQMGVIAQDIEKIFPDLVDTDAEGYKSVNYLQLTPLIIEAIKELKKENEALKNELTIRLSTIESILNVSSQVTLPNK